MESDSEGPKLPALKECLSLQALRSQVAREEADVLEGTVEKWRAAESSLHKSLRYYHPYVGFLVVKSLINTAASHCLAVHTQACNL